MVVLCSFFVVLEVSAQHALQRRALVALAPELTPQFMSSTPLVKASAQGIWGYTYEKPAGKKAGWLPRVIATEVYAEGLWEQSLLDKREYDDKGFLVSRIMEYPSASIFQKEEYVNDEQGRPVRCDIYVSDNQGVTYTKTGYQIMAYDDVCPEQCIESSYYIWKEDTQSFVLNCQYGTYRMEVTRNAYQDMTHLKLYAKDEETLADKVTQEWDFTYNDRRECVAIEGCYVGSDVSTFHFADVTWLRSDNQFFEQLWINNINQMFDGKKNYILSYKLTISIDPEYLSVCTGSSQENGSYERVIDNGQKLEESYTVAGPFEAKMSKKSYTEDVDGDGIYDVTYSSEETFSYDEYGNTAEYVRIDNSLAEEAKQHRLFNYAYEEGALVSKELFNVIDGEAVPTSRMLYSDFIKPQAAGIHSTVDPNSLLRCEGGLLHLSLPESWSYQVYDAAGCSITVGDAKQHTVDLRSMPSGVYLVELYSPKGRMTVKVVK